MRTIVGMMKELGNTLLFILHCAGNIYIYIYIFCGFVVWLWNLEFLVSRKQATGQRWWVSHSVVIWWVRACLDVDFGLVVVGLCMVKMFELILQNPKTFDLNFSNFFYIFSVFNGKMREMDYDYLMEGTSSIFKW